MCRILARCSANFAVKKPTKTKDMSIISINDCIFVNVLLNGTSLLNISLSGIGSVKELMQQLHKMLHQYSGRLLTLQVRNSTRGWNYTNSMLFAA